MHNTEKMPARGGSASGGKKILVIKSHPKEGSFCDALADKY